MASAKAELLNLTKGNQEQKSTDKLSVGKDSRVQQSRSPKTKKDPDADEMILGGTNSRSMPLKEV